MTSFRPYPWAAETIMGAGWSGVLARMHLTRDADSWRSAECRDGALCVLTSFQPLSIIIILYYYCLYFAYDLRDRAGVIVIHSHYVYYCPWQVQLYSVMNTNEWKSQFSFFFALCSQSEVESLLSCIVYTFVKVQIYARLKFSEYKGMRVHSLATLYLFVTFY